LTTAVTPTEQKVLTEADFPHVTWNGIPFFFANTKDDIGNILQVFSLSHFYVLGNSMEYDPTSKKIVDTGIKLFLVINNTLGISIQHVYGGPLAGISQGTKLKLPKIPRKMIASIDAFFREVYKLNSTEAIVILTYDVAKTGPEGWGYIVPDQKNTGGHCDYKPESIAERLPNDTTVLVGTAHSHPGMDAYKSDTDQKDQLAAGDGVHMTFGWKAAVDGGATKFYCEIQFGQYQEQVTPDYLFDDFNYEIDMEAIKKDIEENVKKASFQSGTTGTTSSGGTSNSGTGYQGGRYGGASHSVTSSKNRLVNLPAGGPKKDDSTIVIPVYQHPESKKYHCTGCSTELCPPEVERRKCMICKMPLAFAEDTIDTIIQQRKDTSTSWDELDINSKPKLPIYIWTRSFVDAGAPEDEFAMVYVPEKSTPGK
jgi:hypothetical protein